MNNVSFQALLKNEKYAAAVMPILALLKVPQILARSDNGEEKNPQQMHNPKQLLFKSYLEERKLQLGLKEYQKSREYFDLKYSYEIQKKQAPYLGITTSFFLPFAFLYAPGFSLINKAILDKKYFKTAMIGIASFFVSLIPPLSAIAYSVIYYKLLSDSKKALDEYRPKAMIVLQEYNKDEYKDNIEFRKKAKFELTQIQDTNITRVTQHWQKQKKVPAEEIDPSKVRFFMTPQQVQRYQLYAKAKVEYEAADQVSDGNVKGTKKEKILKKLFTEINKSKTEGELSPQILQEVERVCNQRKKS